MSRYQRAFVLVVCVLAFLLTTAATLSLDPGRCEYVPRGSVPAPGHRDFGPPWPGASKHLHCALYPLPAPAPTPTPHVRAPAVSVGTMVTTADGWQLTVLGVEWHYEAVVRQAYPDFASRLRLLPGEQMVAVKLRAVDVYRDWQGYRRSGQLGGFALVSRSMRVFYFSPHSLQPMHARDLARRGIPLSRPKLAAYHAFPDPFHPDEVEVAWIIFAVPASVVEGLELRRYNGGLDHSWWRLEVE